MDFEKKNKKVTFDVLIILVCVVTIVFSIVALAKINHTVNGVNAWWQNYTYRNCYCNNVIETQGGMNYALPNFSQDATQPSS